MEDILDVTIVGDTAGERLASLAAQLGDLYDFRVGSTPVALSFDESGPTLEDAVTRYFTALRQGVLP